MKSILSSTAYNRAYLASLCYAQIQKSWTSDTFKPLGEMFERVQKNHDGGLNV